MAAYVMVNNIQGCASTTVELNEPLYDNAVDMNMLLFTRGIKNNNRLTDTIFLSTARRYDQ